MAPTRWPSDLCIQASCTGQADQAGSAGRCRKPGARPADRLAGQPVRRQPNRRPGRDPGSRRYAPVQSRPGEAAPEALSTVSLPNICLSPPTEAIAIWRTDQPVRAADLPPVAFKAEMVFALAIHVGAIEAPADHGSLAGDLRIVAGRVIAPLSTQRGASGVARFAGRLARRPAAGEAFRAPFIAADRQLVKALLQQALHRDELARAADAADVHAQLLETVFACIFLLDGDRHLSWRAGSAHPSWRSCRNENPCPASLRGRGGAAGAIITALLHARQPETLPQPVEQRGAGVGGGRRSSHR